MQLDFLAILVLTEVYFVSKKKLCTNKQSYNAKRHRVAKYYSPNGILATAGCKKVVKVFMLN